MDRVGLFEPTTAAQFASPFCLHTKEASVSFLHCHHDAAAASSSNYHVCSYRHHHHHYHHQELMYLYPNQVVYQLHQYLSI
jgi:hypothetical protein